MQTDVMIAAASRLAKEITITAVAHGMPRETNHNAKAAIKPNHAVTTRIAATTPQATIHTSARPARRVSSDSNSRKSEMTRRADANAPDSSSRTLWGGDLVPSGAALLPNEASPVRATLPCRRRAVLSGRLRELSNPRSEYLTNDAADQEAGDQGDSHGFERVCRDVLACVIDKFLWPCHQALPLLAKPFGGRRSNISRPIDRVVGKFRGAIDDRLGFACRFVGCPGDSLHGGMRTGCSLMHGAIAFCGISGSVSEAGAYGGFHGSSPVGASKTGKQNLLHHGPRADDFHESRRFSS